MSLLFDSLRRGRQRGAPLAPTDRKARADAVLTTLGYNTPRQSGRWSPRLAALGVLAIFAAVLWYVWPRTIQPVPGPPGTRAAASGAQAPASVRPGPAAPGAAAENRQDRTAGSQAAAMVATASHTAAQRPSGTGEVAAGAAGIARPATAAVPPPAAAGKEQFRRAPVPPRPDPAPSVDSARRDSSGLFDEALRLHRAGDFDRALAAYHTLLAANPNDPQAHNNFGLLLLDGGRHGEAIRAFERALMIDADYQTARNNLGVALLAASRPGAAEAAFRGVLAADPRNVDAAVNLALVDRQAGRVERAKESLLRALLREPRNAPAHFNLATIYDSAGEGMRAIEHYRAFLDHSGPEHAGHVEEARGRLAVLTASRSRER